MTAAPLPDSQRYLEAALAAGHRAGEIHREHFRSAGLRVDLKADASPVTAADRGSEEAIREILYLKSPGLGLLGEEYGQEGEGRDRWIIDLLDATKNFVAGLPLFATLIGLQLDRGHPPHSQRRAAEERLPHGDDLREREAGEGAAGDPGFLGSRSFIGKSLKLDLFEQCFELGIFVQENSALPLCKGCYQGVR